MKMLIRYVLGAAVLAVLAAAATVYYARHHPAPVYKFIPRAEKTIKIPEGWTNKNIADYLAGLGPWPSSDFLQLAGSAQAGAVPNTRSAGTLATSSAAASDFSKQFSFLADKPLSASLEGYLFPDTYQIYASSSQEEIINRLLSNFDEKLTPTLRAAIRAQGKTIYEIITMASIVEKEAPIDYSHNDNHDAKIIAGIFWNRLKSGQALESDATLSYILNDNQTQHSGADLSLDSPYNTYKYPGLPPGPICNPGLLAIEAAIYPIPTAYNYFLTPPGSRRVIYAQTYQEHLQNRYKYLR